MWCGKAWARRRFRWRNITSAAVLCWRKRWRATRRLAEESELEALYVTGGGSELPLVSRVLREEFGRKVKRSEYTRSATAIGLAIQADATSGYALREMFTRNFGVWREGDAGRRMIFDPIFPRGTRLPGAGEPPLSVRRRYQPVHNVGDFRYLEASQVGEDGQPSGDITVWDEILFPFDPVLAEAQALENLSRWAVPTSPRCSRSRNSTPATRPAWSP